jgi:hypothetical protein
MHAGSAMNESIQATPNSQEASREENSRFSSIPIGNSINDTVVTAEPPFTFFFEDFPLDHPWNWLLSDDVGITPAEYPFWNA